MTWIDVPIGGGGGGGDLLDADLRGGAASTEDRLTCISNFVSPSLGFVTGRFYDNSFHGSNTSTTANSTNRIDLAPFYVGTSLTIDQIGVAVATAVAASSVRLLIYSTGSNGWPDNKLYESADVDTSATGYKFASLSFTFSSDVPYWVGIHENGTATLRTVNLASALNLGLTSSSATTYATLLRKVVTYGSAPDPWGFASADLVTGSPPSIRMRAV